MGVMCGMCQEVLIDDKNCPEGCGHGHGYTYEMPSPWAARTWPQHRCFREQ